MKKKNVVLAVHPYGPLDIPVYYVRGVPAYKGKKIYPDGEGAALFAGDAARRALTDLMVRADEGNRIAIMEQLSILHDFVGDFMFLLRKHGDVARTFTATRYKLPVLVGPNEDYWTEARRLVEEMKVGTSVPLAVAQSAKGNRGRPAGRMPTTPRNAVALSLLEFIDVFRGVIRRRNAFSQGFDIREKEPELKGWARAAVELPEFASVSAAKWADVCIQVLEENIGIDLTVDDKLRKIGANAAGHYHKTPRAMAAAAKRAERRRNPQSFIDEMAPPKEPNLSRTSRADMNARIRSEIRAAVKGLAKHENNPI